MRKIIRAIPTIAALLVIVAVAYYRAQPGHHAPVNGKGFLAFFAVYTVVHVAVLLLTRGKGRRSRRSRPSSPYGY